MGPFERRHYYLTASNGRHWDISKIEAWLNRVGYYGSQIWMPFIRLRWSRSIEILWFSIKQNETKTISRIWYTWALCMYYLYIYCWMTSLIWLDIPKGFIEIFPPISQQQWPHKVDAIPNLAFWLWEDHQFPIFTDTYVVSICFWRN